MSECVWVNEHMSVNESVTELVDECEWAGGANEVARALGVWEHMCVYMSAHVGHQLTS